MIHELEALTHARPDEAVERRTQRGSGEPASGTDPQLAAPITKAASKQAYYTIRCLGNAARSSSFKKTERLVLQISALLVSFLP